MRFSVLVFPLKHPVKNVVEIIFSRKKKYLKMNKLLPQFNFIEVSRAVIATLYAIPRKKTLQRQCAKRKNHIFIILNVVPVKV